MFIFAGYNLNDLIKPDFHQENSFAVIGYHGHKNHHKIDGKIFKTEVSGSGSGLS